MKAVIVRHNKDQMHVLVHQPNGFVRNLFKRPEIVRQFVYEGNTWMDEHYRSIINTPDQELLMDALNYAIEDYVTLESKFDFATDNHLRVSVDLVHGLAARITESNLTTKEAHDLIAKHYAQGYERKETIVKVSSIYAHRE